MGRRSTMPGPVVLAVCSAIGGGTLIGAARASPEVWASLYDARLTEAADRDPAAAVAIYEALVADLGHQDPLLDMARLGLGSALVDQGQLAAATDALEAVRGVESQVQARELLALAEARDRRVRGVPYRASFVQGLAPFARGYNQGEHADLYRSRLDGEDGAVLGWKTVVTDGLADFIFCAIEPDSRRLGQVRLELRARNFPAYLRVLLEDVQGRRWMSSVMDIDTVGFTVVELGPSAFFPASTGAGQLKPGRIAALIIQDLTAFESESRGENRLHIDTFELR